jgi:hypothetical protein
MNFQEKLFENTAALRARAAALATKRVAVLKGSFSALTVAGRELNKVARRHALRFVKENSSLAMEAGKDVSALARTTYATLAKRTAAPKQKARKTPAVRKRVAAKAA